jgi:hypothetical protein
MAMTISKFEKLLEDMDKSKKWSKRDKEDLIEAFTTGADMVPRLKKLGW